VTGTVALLDPCRSTRSDRYCNSGVSGDVTTRLQNIAANLGVAINVRDAAGTVLEMFPPF